MNKIDEILPIAKPAKKRFTRSLEYQVIAHLTLQRYVSHQQPSFELLLSIPLSERVPALIATYGLKRLHGLIKLMLQESCLAVVLPKRNKLSPTQVEVCACDLLLMAAEDQLSIEDLVVFFELCKSGNYGKWKGAITHAFIMEKMESYCTERHAAFVKIKEHQQAAYKLLGPVQRTSPQPTAIKNLFTDFEPSSGLKKIS